MPAIAHPTVVRTLRLQFRSRRAAAVLIYGDKPSGDGSQSALNRVELHHTTRPMPHDPGRNLECWPTYVSIYLGDYTSVGFDCTVYPLCLGSLFHVWANDGTHMTLSIQLSSCLYTQIKSVQNDEQYFDMSVDILIGSCAIHTDCRSVGVFIGLL